MSARSVTSTQLPKFERTLASVTCRFLCAFAIAHCEHR